MIDLRVCLRALRGVFALGMFATLSGGLSGCSGQSTVDASGGAAASGKTAEQTKALDDPVAAKKGVVGPGKGKSGGGPG